MIVNIYAVRDSKVEAYNQPFYSPTHGSALRAFADHVNQEGTAANKHPDDFSLFHLGSFDDQEGTIESGKPVKIGEAREYVTKEK